MQMRFLLSLLLTLAISLNAYASAGQWNTCCPDTDCGMVQCIDMGCLPVNAPALPQTGMIHPEQAAVRDVPAAIKPVLPGRLDDIWTPPD